MTWPFSSSGVLIKVRGCTKIRIMLSSPGAALNSIEVIEIYELLIRSLKQNEEPEIPICQD